MPDVVKAKIKPSSIVVAAEAAEIIQAAENDILLIVNSALGRVQLRTEKMRTQIAVLLSDVLESAVILEDRHVEAMDIINKVAELTGILPEMIMGRSRRRDIVEARQIAMFVIYNYAPLSFTEIGRIFEKDHTTVVSSRDRVLRSLSNGGNTAIVVSRVVTELNLKRLEKRTNPRRGKAMSESAKRNVQIGAKKRLDNRW